MPQQASASGITEAEITEAEELIWSSWSDSRFSFSHAARKETRFEESRREAQRKSTVGSIRCKTCPLQNLPLQDPSYFRIHPTSGSTEPMTGTPSPCRLILPASALLASALLGGRVSQAQSFQLGVEVGASLSTIRFSGEVQSLTFWCR